MSEYFPEPKYLGKMKVGQELIHYHLLKRSI